MSLSCDEISALLSSAFSADKLEVAGADGKYQVTMVASVFEGLNRVKRQQAVYKVLNPHIASGAIHAVTMILATPQEAGQ